MNIITAQDLGKLETNKRTALINSITGIKPINLIGSISQQGNKNLAIMSSVVHLGSNPALIGLFIRPSQSSQESSKKKHQRDTYKNIIETQYYTINHVHKKIIPKAHQTSARYSSEISEFESVGLTEYNHEKFQAPFVQEAKIKFGLKLIEDKKIDANGVHFIIGSIDIILLSQEHITPDGTVDLKKAGTICGTGLNRYHEISEPQILPYAKPNQPF